jgi:hypothetical protein
LIEHGARRWQFVDEIDESLRPAVEHLLRERPLLRRDERDTKDRVELGHDRLVGVVVRQNAAWREREDSLDAYQRAVDGWVRSRKDQTFLWKNAKSVAAFETWLGSHPGASQDEKDFLNFSKKATRDRQRGSWLVGLLISLGFVSSISYGGFTYNRLKLARMTEAFALTSQIDGKCRSDLLEDSENLRRLWPLPVRVPFVPTRYEDPSMYALVSVFPTTVESIRSFLEDEDMDAARARFKVLDDRIRDGGWQGRPCQPFEALGDPPPVATLTSRLEDYKRTLCELARDHPGLWDDPGVNGDRGTPEYCPTPDPSVAPRQAVKSP